MRGVIDRVLGIIERVNMQIDFDPFFARARDHALARSLMLDSRYWIKAQRFLPVNIEHLQSSIQHLLSSMNGKSACERASSIYHSSVLVHWLKLGWWNGRHVRLRGVCRKACGFKSRPEHQI